MDSTIIDPRTGKHMARISLVGKPVPADVMSSASGHLQGYIILSEQENLWRAWVEQLRVLIRTEDIQRVVRIVTYPADKDKQGYLDIISVVNGNNEHTPQPGIQTS